MTSSPLRALAAMLVLAACGPGDDRLPGPNDHAAEHSCEALEDTPTPITAASDEAGAAGAVLLLDSTPYLVTLPDGALGYATLRVDVEHSYMAMFVREREAVIEAPGDAVFRRHALCPGSIGDDIRMHVDEPGDYLVTFSPEGPREVWLQVVLESAGHDEDAGEHDHPDAGP
jgi:hypothetical protein